MAHLSGRAFLRMVLSAAALASPFAAAAAERTLTIETQDGPRTAIVEAQGEKPRPTIIVLHGAYMGASIAARATHFKESAAAHGYNAVFPHGLGRVWIDGRNFRTGADDVGFLKALAARLVADGVADQRRLYLAGISNGGFMTFRMMCEAPEPFAGFGTVIAGIGAETAEACRPKRALPLAMIAGTADPLVPYDGGGVGFRGRNGEVWGAERTAELFAHANGCEAADRTATPDGESTTTSIVRIAWRCTASARVVLYRIEGGGHQSYGGNALPQFAFGRTTQAFSAPEAILDFFDALPKGAP